MASLAACQAIRFALTHVFFQEPPCELIVSVRSTLLSTNITFIESLLSVIVNWMYIEASCKKPSQRMVVACVEQTTRSSLSSHLLLSTVYSWLGFAVRSFKSPSLVRKVEYINIIHTKGASRAVTPMACSCITARKLKSLRLRHRSSPVYL